MQRSRFASLSAPLAIVAGLMLAGLPGAVSARTFGNPVPAETPGQAVVGAELATMNRDFQVKVGGCVVLGFSCSGSATGNASWNNLTGLVAYALSNGGVVQGEVGTVSYGGGKGSSSVNGTEFGATYRQRLGSQSEFSGKPLLLGALGGVQLGSGSDFSYTEFQAAGGASVTVSPLLRAYAALVFDHIDGNYSSGFAVSSFGNGASLSFTSNSDLGLYGGADYKASPQLTLGGEVHLVIESGIALYLRYAL